MAWPASTQSIADAYALSNRTALSIRALVLKRRDEAVAGPVERDLFRSLQRKLTDAILTWNEAILLAPDIVTYAQSQFRQPGLNVIVEFNAMVAGATTLRAQIHTTFPTDAGSGADLSATTDAAGIKTKLTFASAQLTQFVTDADLFLATIV